MLYNIKLLYLSIFNNVLANKVQILNAIVLIDFEEISFIKYNNRFRELFGKFYLMYVPKSSIYFNVRVSFDENDQTNLCSIVFSYE